MSSLTERLGALEQRIAAACTRANRPRESVKLIAVSKLHPPEAIEAAHQLGLRDFGENYAQELRDKAKSLSGLDALRWHAIGPVQTKNAKYIAAVAHRFHALDDLESAKELDRRRADNRLGVLIEVNLGDESSKSGVSLADVPALAKSLKAFQKLELVGLTGLPPPAENPESSRPHFQELATAARELGLKELSIGTTQDFEVAIEEGATWIRVGTALFGERPTAP